MGTFKRAAWWARQEERGADIPPLKRISQGDQLALNQLKTEAKQSAGLQKTLEARLLEGRAELRRALGQRAVFDRELAGLQGAMQVSISTRILG